MAIEYGSDGVMKWEPLRDGRQGDPALHRAQCEGAGVRAREGHAARACKMA